MSQVPWRLIDVLVLALVLIAVSGTCQVQDWRYGKQIAEQADMTAISNAASDQIRIAQDKRLAVEQRLSASEQTHYRKLSDAQRSGSPAPSPCHF